MAPGEVWCEITVLGPDGGELARWAVSGPGVPSMVVVDGLARLHLAARQAGATVVCHQMVPELAALVRLSGLAIPADG